MALNQMSALTIGGQRTKSRESQMVFFIPWRFPIPCPRKANDTFQYVCTPWGAKSLTLLDLKGASAGPWSLSQGPTQLPP